MSYKEPTGLQSVKAFHDLFAAYVGESPAIPPQEVIELRVSLLQEELNELKDAFAQGDLVEVADALTDLQYVLSGAVLACGMQDCFGNLFDEVQRSNMSKACSTKEEAEATAARYKKERGTDSYIQEKDDKFIVLRVGDNKVLKSIEYSPAQLDPILAKSKK